MATQTSTIQVKGKLGNVVGYRGRGKQLARIRVTEIKNPNTIGQAIQRMITATNARAYSRLKSICDHSFEGVSYGQLSQDFFLKYNAQVLRTFVADNYPEFTEQDARNYIGLSGKDDAYSTGVGLLISRGSLPSVPVVSIPAGGEDGDTVLGGFGSFVTVAGENAMTVAQALASLGAVLGDQITVVHLLNNGQLVKARYVTSVNATEAQLAANFSDANFRAICTAKSEYDSRINLDFANRTGSGQYVVTTVNSYAVAGVAGAAVILSRKAADGSWLRSTQRLSWTGDLDVNGLESPQVVIPEWQAGVTPIDTTNPYYLNQSNPTQANS